MIGTIYVEMSEGMKVWRKGRFLDSLMSSHLFTCYSAKVVAASKYLLQDMCNDVSNNQN